MPRLYLHISIESSRQALKMQKKKQKEPAKSSVSQIDVFNKDMEKVKRGQTSKNLRFYNVCVWISECTPVLCHNLRLSPFQRFYSTVVQQYPKIRIINTERIHLFRLWYWEKYPTTRENAGTDQCGSTHLPFHSNSEGNFGWQSRKNDGRSHKFLLELWLSSQARINMHLLTIRSIQTQKIGFRSRNIEGLEPQMLERSSGLVHRLG